MKGVALVTTGSLFINSAYADTTNITVAEMQFNRGSYRAILKPIHNINPNGINNLELMIGRHLNKPIPLNAYIYWKGDNKGKSWIGLRTDYEHRLNKNTKAKLQLRYFTGLNDESNEHSFVIPSLIRKVNDELSLDLTGYFIFDKEKELLYTGPGLTYRISSDISLYLYPSVNLNDLDDKLLYFKTTFNF